MYRAAVVIRCNFLLSFLPPDASAMQSVCMPSTMIKLLKDYSGKLQQ